MVRAESSLTKKQCWKIQSSTKEEMDGAISKLGECKDDWIKVSLGEKINILEESIQAYGRIMDDWVARNLEAKCAVNDPYAVGLEWIGGPVVILRYLQGLHKALLDIQKGGVPKFVGPLSRLQNGQVAAQIYPSSLYERIVTSGVTTEVWMESGVTMDNLAGTQAVFYREKQGEGSVVLVLGGGNVAGIPVNDAFYKLFVENQVVILKMNPVNEYLGPLIEKCFARLISNGFLQVVYGGAEEGNYLCHHPEVDEIHMTGSAKTFDAIVFGAGDEGERRKKNNQPVISKRFTCELGNIAPAIIIPGPWSSSDLEYQAEQLVSHLCDNASFSCSRTRVILNYNNWPLREKLLGSMRKVISGVPLRNAYYPGAHDLQERFISVHPEAETFGTPEGDQLPWTMITDLHPDDQDDICFTTESFCPVMSETAIEADSIPDFIDRAVDFANQKLLGTLSATIIVHPKSLHNPDISSAVERAIMNLRFGQVIVNGIPGMAWIMSTPPWGSFPGNNIQDIQSGIGHVHNVFMFSNPEKTVVRSPFRQWPKPFWFNSQAQIFEQLAKKIAQYDLNPSWWKVTGIIFTALGV